MPERSVLRAAFHPEATAEFLDVYQAYGSEAATLAADFEAEVQRALAQLGRHPESAPMVARRIVRRKVLPRFPYSLVYAVEPDRIRVLAVAHHKRRPLYWLHRLRH